MASAPPRTPLEVCAHHGAAPARDNEAIREIFAHLLTELPDANWELKSQLFDGDVPFLERPVDSAASIQAQTSDTRRNRRAEKWT